MRLSIFILLFLLPFNSVYPQQIGGKITDARTQSPLGGAIITLKEDSGIKIIKYAQSNEKGEFVIKINTSSERPYLLTASLMGYAEKVIKTGNGEKFYNIALDPRPIELREVVVKPRKIIQKRDTLIYDVSSFSDTYDRSIGDVLKKMPGIEMSQSGGIKFNGIPINKFYIEGLDLLEGRYGLAVNNISRQDVKSIEIYEHHQPVKALEDISFSNSAAVNLKLKDKAKSRWIGEIKAGAGFSPLLWDGALFGMLINPGVQSMNTAKSNNTGKEILSEIKNFTIQDIFGSGNISYPGTYYVLPQFFIPGIKDNRWLFNKSYMASSNNLWKIAKDYQIKNQLSYSGMKTDNNSSASTEYFFPDGSTNKVEEIQNTKGSAHNLSGNIILYANKPEYYLKNNLNAELKWDKTEIHTAGTFNNFQKNNLHNLRVADDIEIIKRIKNNTISFKSLNSYHYKPHELHISDKDLQLSETLKLHLLSSVSNISYSATVNRIILSATGSLKMYGRNMDNTANTLINGEDNLNFNSSLGYINSSAAFKIQYSAGNLLLSADMPLNYIFYRVKSGDNNRKHNLFYISPNLTVRYNPSPKVEFSLSGTLYGKDLNNYYVFYPGIILRNYRNIIAGTENMRTGNINKVSFRGSYKEPMKTLFINWGCSYNRTITNYLPEKEFAGKYIINSFRDKTSKKRSLFIWGGINKSLDAIYTFLFFNISYLGSKAELLQNKVIVPYTSSVLNISPSFEMNFIKWGKLKYELNYNYNILKPSDKKSDIIKSESSQLNEKLAFFINPVKNINLKVTGEHFYSGEVNNKNSFFLDITATYKISEKLEAGCEASNIFNYKELSYGIFDDLSRIKYTYRLRPFNILFSISYSF